MEEKEKELTLQECLNLVNGNRRIFLVLGAIPQILEAADRSQRLEADAAARLETMNRQILDLEEAYLAKHDELKAEHEGRAHDLRRDLDKYRQDEIAKIDGYIVDLQHTLKQQEEADINNRGTLLKLAAQIGNARSELADLNVQCEQVRARIEEMRALAYAAAASVPGQS